MTARFPKPGDLFAGRYRIESTIGMGGFARVYRATQAELGRQVAVKLLSRGVLEELDSTRDERRAKSASKRFKREARLVSQLKDSNTVTIYDYGETDEGLLYIVFELIDGTNLKELGWSEGPLQPARVVRILRCVLSSLQEAHRMGVLHRDIKPSNVMVFDYMGEERVKLLDFGIAKVRGKTVDLTTQSELTSEGALVGTPRYMAPEQIRDKAVSPASDIFSLGLVAYEILAKTRANDCQTPVRVIGRQLDDEPFRLPEELDVPDGLRRCVHRMLAKDVERRFQNVEEVLAALEHWDDDSGDEPAVEYEPKAQSRPPPAKTIDAVPTSRSRPRFVLAAALFLAVVAGGGALFWFGDPIRDVDPEPTADRAAATKKRSRTGPDVVEKPPPEPSVPSSEEEPPEDDTDQMEASTEPGSPSDKETESAAQPVPEVQRKPRPRRAVRPREREREPSEQRVAEEAAEDETFAPEPVDALSRPIESDEAETPSEDPQETEPDDSKPSFFSLDDAT